MDKQLLREQIAASVGGKERLASFYSARTMRDLGERAEREIEDAAETIEGAVERVEKAIAEAGLGEYHSGSEALVKVLIRAWAMYQNAGSRVANWFVTGPSNFPVARNQKRMDSEMRRYEEFAAIAAKAPERSVRIARAKQRARIGAGGLAHNELQGLKARLQDRETLHRRMKATNETIRRNKLGRTVEDAERLVELMRERGFPISKSIAIQLLTPDYGSAGYPGYSLSNNNAEIKRLQGRVADVERKLANISEVEESGKDPAERIVNGVRIVEDVADDRLRLFFDGKPAPHVIRDLKGRGFRWSPSQGAWQRQLTNNARYAAEQLVGAQAA